jgi:hypothetical protein
MNSWVDLGWLADDLLQLRHVLFDFIPVKLELKRFDLMAILDATNVHFSET